MDDSLRNLKHDGIELERMVTQKMIEDCKLDACVDVLLEGLAKIQGLKPWRDLPDPATFGSNNSEGYQKITSQLREHLDHLLPGYLHDKDGSNIIYRKTFKDRLERRWKLRATSMVATKDKASDSFEDALLNMLTEREYQKRTENVQPHSIPTPLEEVNAYCQLRQYIEGETESASFACGGTILIDSTTSDAPLEKSSPQPILPASSFSQIYSGPLGLFRKHVDTPRSENQIGSLVVCLPSRFKGGMLIIQHNRQLLEFDWSPQSESAIQWVAFYSDCEHEIQTVTDGNRITLTYNLYVSEPVGSIHPQDGIVLPQSLPLHGFLKDLMCDPRFMSQGGVLGVYCSHAYPHASEIANMQLPRGLKGADLVLYTVLQSLGIEVDIRPVLEYCGEYGSQNLDLGIKGIVRANKRHYFSSWDYYDSYYWRTYMSAGIDRYWKLLLMSRRVRGMRDLTEVARREGVAIHGWYANEGARVGTKCESYVTADRGQEEGLDDVSQDVWPAWYLPGIVWINEPKHEEMALSQISFGNEAAVGTRYSCAAILAVIPPFDERPVVSAIQ
ncbi:hypothetical protein FE257_010418 [Aspergillus nanangensis]|uniref:Prolyl 4-hydroxylase alpha subunit Fe(2+) 2OG dioxygenase domain-containing protein n=1 Tax=Aspergillus nanangensis TaxID=2582783 RepID=A0AAD4CIG0_ASPNN|nr:hypothetical protein FE257_010418 [Aspergillus nanangensis]